MLGFMSGKYSRVTILDMDTCDEKTWADALAIYGDTPLLVRTMSGHCHGYYRHAGERRLIRPFPDKPIDILGSGGFSVAAPSVGYEIIQGSLDCLDNLPYLRGAEIALAPSRAPDGPVREGKRNESLFEYCMRMAQDHCDDFDQLLDAAMHHNSQFLPPLSDNEVRKTAESAWRMTERGDNWYGRHGKRVAAIPHQAVDKLISQPYALSFLLFLKRYHWNRNQFALAKETAEKLGWTLVRFRQARKILEDLGIIRCIHPGGKGPNDPPVYCWNPGIWKSQAIEPRI
jgi:hypothetical protein